MVYHSPYFSHVVVNLLLLYRNKSDSDQHHSSSGKLAIYRDFFQRTNLKKLIEKILIVFMFKS